MFIKKKIIFLLLIVGVLLMSESIFAAVNSSGTILLEKLPGMGNLESEIKSSFSENGNPGTALQLYVNWAIQVSVVIGSILAVGVIILGGIKYMTTDSFSGKTEGREHLTNAIMGLIFLIGGYLIFEQVNPNILNISFSKTQVEIDFTAGSEGMNVEVPPESIETSTKEEYSSDSTVSYGASVLEEVEIQQWSPTATGGSIDSNIPNASIEEVKKTGGDFGAVKTAGDSGNPTRCNGNYDPINYLFCRNTNSMTDPNIHPTLKSMFSVFTKRVEEEMNLRYGSDYSVSQSGRSKDQHIKNLGSGASQAKVSKHCWGGAFDIHYIKGYDSKTLSEKDGPLWKMGEIWYKIAGQSGMNGSINAFWGGKWTSLYDPYHFQLPGNASRWWNKDGTSK